MGRLVGRQRTVYDPNAPLTEEQKAMAEGDRRVIIAAVVATSGVILVLVLLGYAYRHYKRYSAKRRQRARHRLGDVPPPPSPANVPQVHFPNPGDIALNDLGGLRMWTPEYGDRPARDSTSSGSIPVGLDNGSGDHVIVTPLGPAPPYPGRGSGVNSPIGPAVTAHHTEAVSNTPLTTPDLIPLPSTVANTGPANTAETPLGLIRVDHQVPPYANDVRAERRRREREQMRNRHRGVPREPIVFNDRMWVEITDGAMLNLEEFERQGGQLPT